VLCLAPQRRLQQAWVEIQQPRDLDPISPVINAHLGWIFYLRRQFNEATEQLRKTVRLAPSFYLARWHVGFTFVQMRRVHEALASFREAEVLGSVSRLPWPAWAIVMGFWGKEQPP
jgi:tetratricopeptide (TPR) repeat protein